jgi:hypothetical protein
MTLSRRADPHGADHDQIVLQSRRDPGISA